MLAPSISPSLRIVFLTCFDFFTICAQYFFSFVVSMNKKKLVRKVQTVMTVKDFGSSVIVTYMAVLLASSTVHLAESGDHGVRCTVGESGLCHPQATVPDWVIRLHNLVKTLIKQYQTSKIFKQYVILKPYYTFYISHCIFLSLFWPKFWSFWVISSNLSNF